VEKPSRSASKAQAVGQARRSAGEAVAAEGDALEPGGHWGVEAEGHAATRTLSPAGHAAAGR
jgi:hypothetical protein